MRLVVLFFVLFFVTQCALFASIVSIYTYSSRTVINIKGSDVPVSIDSDTVLKCKCGNNPVFIVYENNGNCSAECETCLKEKYEQSVYEEDDGPDCERYSFQRVYSYGDFN